MRTGLIPLKGCAIALTAGLATIGIVAAEVRPASAAQSFFCNGRMNNGWAYSATFWNGKFTQIRWERSGQPPQTTTLTFSGTNSQGQPIYRGVFQSATAVTLLDLSRGNVGPGSQITVTVEEWGTSTGSCGTSGTIGTTPPPAPPTPPTPPTPPPTSSRLFCDGRMNNGWAYTAEYDNRRFNLIRWQRSGVPPQTSTLTRSGTNAQGQPVYRGVFQSATNVTLIDLSRGNVRPGSEISVSVEEWGWSRGRCRR